MEDCLGGSRRGVDMNRRAFIGSALGAVLAAKLLPVKQGVPDMVKFVLSPELQTFGTWRGARMIVDENVPEGFIYFMKYIGNDESISYAPSHNR